MACTVMLSLRTASLRYDRNSTAEWFGSDQAAVDGRSQLVSGYQAGRVRWDYWIA